MSSLGRGHRKSDAKQRQKLADVLLYIARQSGWEAARLTLFAARQKTFGQDMLQIAAHEFVAGKGAGLVAIGLSILVAEGHVGVVEDEQPPVGDGDAKGVTGEIVEHRLLALAPGLDVNDPALPPDVIGKFDAGIGYHQGFSEQAGRALGKSGFGEEKGRRRLMPTLAVSGQAAGGNQAMEMGMLATTVTIP